MQHVTRRAKKLAKVVVPTAVAAGALFGLTSVAGATEVVPAGDHYEATSDETTFIDANGNGNDVSCHGDDSVTPEVPASTATGQVPPAGANNNNQLPEGSVIGPIDSLVFEGCDAVNGQLGADVTTSGGHTLASHGEMVPDALSYAPGADAAVAVGLPPSGSLIDVGPGVCTIDVSPSMASSVFGAFENGDPTSLLYVKGQVLTDQGCGDVNPSVFFANGEEGTTPYEVVNTDTPTSPIEVNPFE